MLVKGGPDALVDDISISDEMHFEFIYCPEVAVLHRLQERLWTFMAAFTRDDFYMGTSDKPLLIQISDMMVILLIIMDHLPSK